jgi:organic radical activating enzyme
VGSIQQGEFTTFLRLAGCNLKCSYCDAKEASEGKVYTQMPINVVQERILDDKVRTKNLLITGGEPLVQSEALLHLMEEIQYEGEFDTIQIETNGYLPLEFQADCFVMDCKLDRQRKNTSARIVSTNIKEYFSSFRNNITTKIYVKFPISIQYMSQEIDDLGFYFHCIESYFLPLLESFPSIQFTPKSRIFFVYSPLVMWDMTTLQDYNEYVDQFANYFQRSNHLFQEIRRELLPAGHLYKIRNQVLMNCQIHKFLGIVGEEHKA